MSKVGVLSHQKTDNAVKLTEQDVINLRQMKIQNLPFNSNTWAIKYGFESLAISNICTNITINNYFRSKFLLKNTSILASLSSHALVCLLPPVASAAFSSAYFNNFLFKTSDECLTCREIKTVLLHASIGSLFPTGISLIISFLHAELFKTYGVPKTDQLFKSNSSRLTYFKQAKEILKKTTKGSSKILTINYSIQVILCSFIMFMQQKQFFESVLPLKFTQVEIEKIKIRF